jgi:hypothetical protein
LPLLLFPLLLPLLLLLLVVLVVVLRLVRHQPAVIWCLVHKRHEQQHRCSADMSPKVEAANATPHARNPA